MYKMTIETEKNLVLSESHKKQIISALNVIPLNIVKYCIKNHCRIQIVSTINGSALGQYEQDRYLQNKKIQIVYGTLKLNEFQSVLLHEIGHMIDYDYKTMQNYYLVSETVIFKRIARKENEFASYMVEHKANLSEDFFEYCISSKEYFAESFKEYILEPWKLKSNAPKTYEFMKQYIEKL